MSGNSARRAVCVLTLCGIAHAAAYSATVPEAATERIPAAGADHANSRYTYAATRSARGHSPHSPAAAAQKAGTAAFARSAARRAGISAVPSTPRRPAAPLTAGAGNGVIGGPRAAGRGMIGGPAAIARPQLKASLDGSALHRRY